MGLIQCPDCGKMVSDRAAVCPNCGGPVENPTAQIQEQYASDVGQYQASQNASSGGSVGSIIFGILALIIAGLAIWAGSYGFGLFMGLCGFVCFSKSMVKDASTPQYQASGQPYRQGNQTDTRLRCLNCGGYNIQVSVNTVNQVIGSTREVREKNAVTREFNKESRRLMNVATLGLWSLTPKPSDYKETERVKSRNIQYKTAVCQSCGYSWNI